DQHVDIVRHIAPHRRAVRRDERNAIAARALLERGAREGMQRGAIMDDTGLHCGLKTAGERKAADREHRVAELQQARRRAAVAVAVAVFPPGRYRRSEPSRTRRTP